jgi:hypothetical protein
MPRRPEARRKRSVSSVRPPKTLRRPSLSLDEFEDNLIEVCVWIADAQRAATVKDPSGRIVFTLDPLAQESSDEIANATYSFFAKHFLQLSFCLRMGLCLRLSKRGTPPFIYARSYAKYRDPLDGVIKQWRGSIAKVTLSRHREQMPRRLSSQIDRIQIDASATTEHVLAVLEQIKGGIRRLAIGHRPFEEGPLPKLSFRSAEPHQHTEEGEL